MDSQQSNAEIFTLRGAGAALTVIFLLLSVAGFWFVFHLRTSHGDDLTTMPPPLLRSHNLDASSHDPNATSLDVPPEFQVVPFTKSTPTPAATTPPGSHQPLPVLPESPTGVYTVKGGRSYSPSVPH